MRYNLPNKKFKYVLPLPTVDPHFNDWLRIFSCHWEDSLDE